MSKTAPISHVAGAVRRWSGAIAVMVALAACTGAVPQPTSDPAIDPVFPPPPPCLEGAPPPQAPVYAFFTCADSPNPTEPRPVPRLAQAADPESRLQTALIELVSGPTDAERAAGYISFFSDETAGALNSATIEADGLAIVDLGDIRFLHNASTSAGSAVLLQQLGATVFQIEEVSAVEFRINGSCEAFWEWLQSTCQVVRAP